MTNDLDTLFYKITHFGYENEYPFGPNYDTCEYIAERAGDRGDGELSYLFCRRYPNSTYSPQFRSHEECGGAEMYNYNPAPSFEELQNVISTIYAFVNDMIGEDTDETRYLRDILDDFYATRESYDDYWDDYENIHDAFDSASDLKRQEHPVWDDDAFIDFINDKYGDSGEDIPNYLENPDQFRDDWNECWDSIADNDYMDAVTTREYYRFRDYPVDIDVDDYYFPSRNDYRLLCNFDLFSDRVDLYDYEIDEGGDTIYTKRDYLNGDSVGVHIRIDVTAWNDTEILRYVRLFSDEFGDGRRYDEYKERYNDYIKWMESYFGRGWSNYNDPIDYTAYYNNYKSRLSDYQRSVRFNQSSKNYNISTEHGLFGDGVITIEMRAFGVNEYLSAALRQADLVKHLCRVVKHSFDPMFDEHMSVVDKLYFAWVDLMAKNLIE